MRRTFRSGRRSACSSFRIRSGVPPEYRRGNSLVYLQLHQPFADQIRDLAQVVQIDGGYEVDVSRFILAAGKLELGRRVVFLDDALDSSMARWELESNSSSCSKFISFVASSWRTESHLATLPPERRPAGLL